MDYARETGEYVIKVYDRELTELMNKLKEFWENGLIRVNNIKKLLENGETYAPST